MGQHKCERCGVEIEWTTRAQRSQLAHGWVGTGGESKYGREWDRRSGRAWWCPNEICQKEKIRRDIKRLIPGASEDLIKYLYDLIILSNLQKN